MNVKEFYNTLNAREKAAFKNFYHCANWEIGSLENTIEDGYDEDGSIEETLKDHEYLTKMVYRGGLGSLYGEGSCTFNSYALSKIKDFKFLGETRLMELAEQAVKFAGY